MITLTEQAADQVKAMLLENEEPEKLYLRLGVEHGGCSGFTYSIGFDAEIAEDEEKLEQHGVRIVIEKENVKLLKGTVIDYQTGVMGGGFSINNPNATLTCGCGTSFRTATETGKPEEC